MFDLVQAKSVIETIVLLVMSLWTFKMRSDWDDDSWFFRILNILVVAFLIWQYITLRGMKIGG